MPTKVKPCAPSDYNLKSIDCDIKERLKVIKSHILDKSPHRIGTKVSDREAFCYAVRWFKPQILPE